MSFSILRRSVATFCFSGFGIAAIKDSLAEPWQITTERSTKRERPSSLCSRTLLNKDLDSNVTASSTAVVSENRGSHPMHCS
jgi:hypothetical protein